MSSDGGVALFVCSSLALAGDGAQLRKACVEAKVEAGGETGARKMDREDVNTHEKKRLHDVCVVLRVTKKAEDEEYEEERRRDTAT